LKVQAIVTSCGNRTARIVGNTTRNRAAGEVDTITGTGDRTAVSDAAGETAGSFNAGLRTGNSGGDRVDNVGIA
jgi:hypothetical protein